MPYENIIVDMPANHVARVTLNRPDKANALSAGLFAELAEAIDWIESADDVRVWLITGAPRPDGRAWFSSGADMNEALAPEEQRLSPSALLDRIDDLLKPSIAVIAGTCTTGALELALACDLRFAADDAQISDWHLKRTGLAIGAWGLAARLSRLVGVDKAKELLLLSETVDGAEAKRIGLVNRVYSPDELMAGAIAAASTIASMPRRGVRTTLGYLSLQSDMSKHEAIRWGELAPELMGLKLRPFSDAAGRFLSEKDRPEN